MYNKITNIKVHLKIPSKPVFAPRARFHITSIKRVTIDTPRFKDGNKKASLILKRGPSYINSCCILRGSGRQGKDLLKQHYFFCCHIHRKNNSRTWNAIFMRISKSFGRTKRFSHHHDARTFLYMECIYEDQFYNHLPSLGLRLYRTFVCTETRGDT